MDAITGWAGKMFMKQKMGSITDSLPGSNKEAETPAKSTRQIRADIKSSRVERDAEMELKKAERAEKKGKISDRWAANKKANS